MLHRRFFSLILIIMILLSTAVVSSSAVAQNPTEGVTEIVKPTQKPTEAPKPSVQQLGYSEYINTLEKTVFDGKLGAIYSKNETTFRLWSPAADAVKVCIYKTGSDDEPGAQEISATSMKYAKKYGTWYLTLKGDYKNMYYTYLVTVNGETNEVVDPYARAVGVNGNRGMIVNMNDTDPKGWENDQFKRVFRSSEAVVWEISVRDFSASESSGVSQANRGKYLAFTESGTTLNSVDGDLPTCVDYLKELGVNYVQINPFYDFASIDEADTETEQYNWGYDPKNFNVPEGSYSSNPYDGRVRIKECKQMIQALHKAGIGVIMDVVYNHTYYSNNSFMNQIVPYYYHRISDSGKWSNGSGCGNDIATERYMVSRFIRDSVTFWANEYHIDGFRFDLMGLIDVDTMNDIRDSLDGLKYGNRILMYGEAWNMETNVPSTVQLANQNNMNLLSKRIGAFNDTGRDAIKGSNFNATEPGFVQTGSSRAGIRSCIDADGGGWASIPNQCVNYASCHDNLTLYDKLVSSVYQDNEYDLRRDDLVAMNKLSAAVVLMSRGTPFMLAGEEMGRTKLGNENSYQSPIEINQIDWNNLRKYTSMVDYYQGLIQIRSAVGVLNDATGKETELTYLDTDSKTTVAYTVGADRQPSLVVAFNGGSQAASIELPDGEWVILADNDSAGLKSLGSASGSYRLKGTAAVVMVDKKTYASIKENTDEAVVYISYKDKTKDAVVFEEKCVGKIGDAYSYTTPDNILFSYNLTEENDTISGTFDSACSYVTVECEAYEGEFSTVTFRFVGDTGEELYDEILMRNRVGQQYYPPMIPGFSGLTLDLSRLPENCAGQYTKDPIEVTFYYKPATTPKDVDPQYTSRANVIYIGSDGKILETKSYMGEPATPVEVEKLSFGGYEFVAVSDNYAAYTEVETNLMVYYEKKPLNILLYLLIAGGVIALIAAVSIVIGSGKKRRKMDSIEIDD